MIYFICYDLKKEDKQTMLKSFQKESYREILQNQEFLYPAKSLATSFSRTHPDMTAAEMKAFNLKNTIAIPNLLKSIVESTCSSELLKTVMAQGTGGAPSKKKKTVENLNLYYTQDQKHLKRKK